MTTLKSIMRELSYASGTRAAYLASIYIDVQDDRATFFATDGYRLAMRTIDLPCPAKPLKAVVRREFMEQAAKVVGGPFSILNSPEPNELLFFFGEQHYAVPVWERRLLSYRHIIGAPVARATVSRKAIIEEIGTYYCRIEILAGQLTVGGEQVGANNVSGDGFVRILPRYLRQALEAMPGHRQVELAIVNNTMALQIRPAGVSDHLALIQPMN
jgi:hypothetical protein